MEWDVRVEALGSAVWYCETTHAQAPVGFGVQRAKAVTATEDPMVDEVFANSLAVVGKRLGNKIVPRRVIQGDGFVIVQVINHPDLPPCSRRSSG
jgi:hypothetical protein